MWTGGNWHAYSGGVAAIAVATTGRRGAPGVEPPVRVCCTGLEAGVAQDWKGPCFNASEKEAMRGSSTSSSDSPSAPPSHNLSRGVPLLLGAILLPRR
mmetsp:Transcript_33386/g.87507  ORF Transcript_33386/g.87507 Transcript_33386/m.87507 type:complete len:98 (+) Transcript_33386:62-355(+)